MRRLAIAAACLGLAAIACAPRETTEPEGPERFEGVGTVVAVEEGFVLIDHEDIPGFMDAMTMSFPVGDASLLSGIEATDRVRFRVVVSEDGSYSIESVERLEGSGREPEPGS